MKEPLKNMDDGSRATLLWELLPDDCPKLVEYIHECAVLMQRAHKTQLWKWRAPTGTKQTAAILAGVFRKGIMPQALFCNGLFRPKFREFTIWCLRQYVGEATSQPALRLMVIVLFLTSDYPARPAPASAHAVPKLDDTAE